MKKSYSVLLALLTAGSITACMTNTPPESGAVDSVPVQQTSTVSAVPAAVYEGKILQVQQDAVLLSGTGKDAGAAQVIRVPLDLALTDREGGALQKEGLQAGMLIEVGYDGSVEETFPARLGSPDTMRVTGTDNDFVGLYLTVLDDLYQTDPGLNGDISCLAFDLTQTETLSEAEKAGLMWLMGERYGLETIAGTFDELAEMGYIDKEKLYFETGILFKIEDTMPKGKTYTFHAEKWRGGLGAYFFHNCTAEKAADGTWSYTIGAEMIS